MKATIFKMQERLKTKISSVRPLLPLKAMWWHEAMLMSVASVTTEGHVDVCGPCWPMLQPRAMLVSWSALLLEAILRSVVHVAAGCSVDVHGLLLQEAMLMSVICVTAKGHVDVCVLYCNWRPC